MKQEYFTPFPAILIPQFTLAPPQAIKAEKRQE